MKKINSQNKPVSRRVRSNPVSDPNLTMSLKDEADSTKKLYHPDDRI